MIKTTTYYKEINKDEPTDFEGVVLDAIECFERRQAAYCFTSEQVEAIKNCVTDTVTVDEFDGYYAVYVELNNKARKEYERDNF